MRIVRGVLVVVLVGVFGVLGCSKSGPSPAEPTRAAVPADSPLAKIQPGMSSREVEALIGPPDSENEYVTGKAFIPWYYGRDRSRRAFFYKGLGRVVFQGGGGFSRNYVVAHTEYDPSEPGRAR
jgi:outer membrane protein assembly factor BamE (lipoprotein component of BamABCDE complex)